MGAWVYCDSHVAPHETGWCTVSTHNKTGLSATTREEAMEESWANGWHVYGYCDTCHRYVSNEPWYLRDRRKTCPEHDDES